MIHVRQLNLLPRLTQSSLRQYFLSFEYNEVPVLFLFSSSFKHCASGIQDCICSEGYSVAELLCIGLPPPPPSPLDLPADKSFCIEDVHMLAPAMNKSINLLVCLL